jgi:heme exporter protein A
MLSSRSATTPDAAPDAPAVELRDVSKRFGPRWAIARLTYALPPGQSLLLTGHNGSGKTPLLRLLATSISPTAGAVRVNGLDAVAERHEVRRRTALLSHANFLYEDLTAYENLSVLARLLLVGGVSDKVTQLLNQVGLEARSGSPVRQFSAGMRKRLAVARLLLKGPKVALLDEPFGELDPSGITQMEELIAQMQAKGTVVVLATHLIDQGRALCRERLHLRDGRAVRA